MKTFKSGVCVLVPGNFVSVHIDKLSRGRDYKVLNQQEFLDKFFTIRQSHPFCFPEVELKDKRIEECVFEITKPGKKEEYIINLDKVWLEEVSLKEVTL